MTAIYVRQSVDRPDSVSIETQEALCRSDLTEGEASRVYADRGFSGKNAERPALQQMLADIRSGRISRVLVYKLDRISRNLADFTQMLALFEAHRVDFSSHTERFETRSPMGQAMQSLLMVFAQLERETISGRVRDAVFARAKQGFDTGGAPPFGYRKESTLLLGKRTHILVPDENAGTVAEGYTQYLDAAQSLHSLANLWNAQKIATSRGNAWSANTLCRLLRNPVYARADAAVYGYLSARGAALCIPEPLPEGHGVYLFADRRLNHSRFTDLHDVLAICAPHEGIVAAELWLQCQKKLDASQKKRTHGTGVQTWLSGRIFCANCGSAMTAVRGRSRGYLICAGKKRGVCTGAGAVWRIEDAESLIGQVLAARMQVLAEYGEISGQSHTRQELETLRLRRERLLTAMTEADDGAAELAEAAARLRARCRVLEAELARQETRLPLPEWSACGFAMRKSIAQMLLRGVIAEGSTLHAILQ